MHAISNHIQYLYDAIDQGHVVLSLFLDFRKAFDSVDHNILSKLQHYGIRGSALAWFRSYLSNRSQYTVVGGETSGVLNITHGIPQGFVLEPLLFLLYIMTYQIIQNYLNIYYTLMTVLYPLLFLQTK